MNGGKEQKRPANEPHPVIFDKSTKLGPTVRERMLEDLGPNANRYSPTSADQHAADRNGSDTE